MRDFINGHRQEVLLKLGIDARDLVLLDYLIKFFESGRAYIKVFDGDFYFNISPAKVIEDMPIVAKSEKTLRDVLKALQDKGVIKRLTYCNQAYISIDYEVLYYGEKRAGENPPPFSEVAEECRRSGGKIPPTIIKYIENKIYIYYNLNKKVAVKKIEDVQGFFKKLKVELFSKMSEASYGVCISKADLSCPSPHLIVLDVKEAMPAVKKYHTKTIEAAFNEVLKSCKLIE